MKDLRISWEARLGPLPLTQGGSSCFSAEKPGPEPFDSNGQYVCFDHQRGSHGLQHQLRGFVKGVQSASFPHDLVLHLLLFSHVFSALSPPYSLSKRID